MKRNKIITIFAIALVVLGIIILASVFLQSNDRNSQSQGDISQLTGVKVAPELAQRPILGVVIENSEPARPQTGLNDAGIVFEAVTEGGITRYLALYQENQPDVVGPIRSLRVGTLDWAMGFDASIAHVGGQPKALELADKRNDARSLNQFDYDKPYYRDNSRNAPHNVYARTKDLRELQKRLNHDQSNFEALPRTEDKPSEDSQANTITLDFSRPQFKAEFRYEASSNSYTRNLAGSPHISKDAEQPIKVKNLIVINLPADQSISDGAVGEGRATVFKDGQVIEARWSKPNFDQRIKIEDADGQEIALNRGQTWIAALPSGKTPQF